VKKKIQRKKMGKKNEKKKLDKIEEEKENEIFNCYRNVDDFDWRQCLVAANCASL
jgi:hypothetical protein